jgi:hypothetical protein
MLLGDGTLSDLCEFDEVIEELKNHIKTFRVNVEEDNKKSKDFVRVADGFCHLNVTITEVSNEKFQGCLLALERALKLRPTRQGMIT